MSISNISLLKLSLQRALLGAVTPNLVAVIAGIEDRLADGKFIRVDAYVSTTVSEEDLENIQVVTTEVIADFPIEFMSEANCYSILEKPLGPLLETPPQASSFLVFLRREPDAST